MNLKKIAGIMLVAIMVIMFTACTSNEDLADEESTIDVEENMDDVSGDVTFIGEGNTVFTFTVTFEDATMHLYEVSTDAVTVGDALLELNLIEGEDSEYGLYVKTVDGVTLDWDTDAAYWAFYVDGEYATSSVDSTEIVDGSIYTFAYAE